MGLTILLVDDIPQNISALKEAIAEDDLTIVTAESGQDALQLLSQMPPVDLALIDVQMPDMDGLELARLIRGVEKTKDIPIIFITAQIPNQRVEYVGYDLGAVDFIYKPVNIKIIKSKINVFRRLKDKRIRLSEKVRELELAQEQIRATEKRAIESDQMKSTFLAHMSHEIRTPITALIGFAELLKPLVAGQEDAQNYVNIILKNGKSLLELLNEILDLSKVEAGQLEVNIRKVQLDKVISNVVKLLSPVAKMNGVVVNFKSSEGARYCSADSVRLRQVVTNIIGNVTGREFLYHFLSSISSYHSFSEVWFKNFRCRGLVAQRAMRSLGVVMMPPSLDDNLGLQKRKENLAV